MAQLEEKECNEEVEEEQHEGIEIPRKKEQQAVEEAIGEHDDLIETAREEEEATREATEEQDEGIDRKGGGGNYSGSNRGTK